MPECLDIEKETSREDAQTAAVQAAVESAIENMRQKLLSGDFKMTVGEFARLLELRKELSADKIRHVKVTWVEPLMITEPVSET